MESLQTEPTSQQPPFSAQISEVLAVALDNDDDMDSQMAALHIVGDLLSKNGAAFDEQFTRLGIPAKILLLAKDAPVEEEAGNDETDAGKEAAGTDMKEATKKETDAKREKKETSSAKGQSSEDSSEVVVIPPEGTSVDKEGESSNPATMVLHAHIHTLDHLPTEELEDAPELDNHTPYQWRDWYVVKSRDCLYLWNEFCAIELSKVSNGWFRFLADNKLATMYSSGNTEGGPDSFGELHVRAHPAVVPRCTCVSKHSADL